MKKITLILCYIGLSTNYLAAQNLGQINGINKTEADMYWENMPRLSAVYYLNAGGITERATKFIEFGPTQEKTLESKIQVEIYREMYNRLLRDWGVEFWKRFPYDDRRFEWLEETIAKAAPYYFANIREGVIANSSKHYVTPLDTLACKEWKSLYNQYKKDFLASNNVDSNRKYKFLLNELVDGIWMGRCRNSEKDKFNVDEYLENIIHFSTVGGSFAKEREHRLINCLQAIFRDKKDFGLDNNDIVRYVKRLKAARFPYLHRVANGIENVIKLEKSSFKFEAKTINGKWISLKNYKNKLILIDFWSLGCSFCIKKMPEVKDVYDSYKDKGFEVISACLFYNNKFQKDELIRITDIHSNIGADWPLVLVGGNEGEQGRLIFNNYGFQSVPQLILLDEEGKLVHYNGDMLKKGGLEKLVRKYFEAQINKIK